MRCGCGSAYGAANVFVCPKRRHLGRMALLVGTMGICAGMKECVMP